MEKTIVFKRNKTDIALMAIMISNLEKEGINYSIGDYINRFEIHILGY